MQNIFLVIQLNDGRQTQLREQLLFSNINIGYALMGWTIIQAHAGKPCINTGWFQSAALHLAFKLFNIKTGWCGVRTENSLSLTVDRFMFSVSAVDFIAYLIVILRKNGRRDFSVLGNNNRFQPDRVFQLQNAWFALNRRRLLYCCTGHFQISHSWQYFLASMPVGSHLMIGKEELFSCKSRAIALLAQIRCVAVQQRMKDSGFQTRVWRAICDWLASRRVDPIALFGKGIRGQAHALWPGFSMHPVPIHFHALHPQFQQLRPLPSCYPLTHRFP